ncbi:MAG: MazG family protein [Desulforhabdus sp.]|jgi:MazG family protein|nr:MazG family protein [Desulforhabdus sp.]
MSETERDRWQKMIRIWQIIGQLRGESGCPWDRKQTPESVQTYLVEEAHEAAAAVRSGFVREAAEELGDLLFMVLFLIHLYEEQNNFRLEDVCDLINEKMIRRHPHVFGDATVNDAREVRSNWEKIKAAEKAAGGKSAGGGVPESLPALMRAYRMLSRMSHDESKRLNDLPHQVREFSRKSERLLEELGDREAVSAQTVGELLMSVVNLARIKGLRAEDILHDSLRSL